MTSPGWRRTKAQPSACATSRMICQSGCASPGGTTAGRTCWMRRSALVKVPSCSRTPAAGSTRCARSAVGSGRAPGPREDRARRGLRERGSRRGRSARRLRPGSTARAVRRARAASSISGIVSPGSSGGALAPELAEAARARPDRRAADSRSAGSGMPPMSALPCTLFWPRSGSMPAPGRPMLPVSSARFASAITDAVPCVSSERPRPCTKRIGPARPIASRGSPNVASSRPP